MHHVSDVRWTRGGRENDIRERDQPQKQHTGSYVQALYRSSGLKTLAWSKLLAFTGKNLLLEFIRYLHVFEYWLLLLHLVSTHVMDETRLPRFSHSSASVYYTERKPKNKKRGRPGNEAR